MSNRIILLVLSILLFSGYARSQAVTYDLSEEEQELKGLFDQLRTSASDEEKKNINLKIIEWLDDILQDDRSFSYPFTITDKIGILNSDDHLLRIYNWNVVYAGNIPVYYGFVQHYNKKKDEYDYWQLEDASEELSTPEMKTLGPDQWYGALYYQIITCKLGRETYYTLLGWDGNNSLINRKVIEILTFGTIGKPRFGKAVFQFVDESRPEHLLTKKKRILFEYSAKGSMMLKYDAKKEFIFFDHLEPIELKYKDLRQFYAPNMMQDILRLEKGIWVHTPNAELFREKSKSTKDQLPPRSDNLLEGPKG